MKRAVTVLLVLAACSRGEQTPAAPAAPAPGGRTEVGDRMPAYSSTYLDGTSFDVAAQKGNVVLLNVWATWCGPCRFETPELENLHQKYGPKGLKVVGVSVDDTGIPGVKQFVSENKITYPIAVDADGKIANILRTTVLPTSVLIGRDGKILWRKVGAVMPNELTAVDAVIEQALAKKS
jgi:cytochrome c biogenesis protein CcmG, thiol:disulfide interchange protein DsbE